MAPPTLSASAGFQVAAKAMPPATVVAGPSLRAPMGPSDIFSLGSPTRGMAQLPGIGRTKTDQDDSFSFHQHGRLRISGSKGGWNRFNRNQGLSSQKRFNSKYSHGLFRYRNITGLPGGLRYRMKTTAAGRFPLAGSKPLTPEVPMAFRMSSRAFKDGETLPTHYTADGEDVSPPLEWHEVPP